MDNRIALTLMFALVLSGCTNSSIEEQKDISVSSSSQFASLFSSSKDKPLTDNVTIAQDFTIESGDDFLPRDSTHAFTYKNFKSMTFDGNGKTITVQGQLDAIGRTYYGFFGSAEDTTIKNLTIRYVDPLGFSLSSVTEYYFGGLLSRATNCVIDNVHVIAERGFSIHYFIGENTSSKLDNGVGGIVGKIQQSTVTNCSFIGNISTTCSYSGGIVGKTLNSILCMNVFSGSIEATHPTNAFAGGITAYLDSTSELSICKTSIYALSFSGENQGLKVAASFGGLLVGMNFGFVHDSYSEFQKNGYLYATKEGGLIKTDVRLGSLMGSTSVNSINRNLYVHALDDDIRNIRTPSNSAILAHCSLCVCDNSSANNYHLYFVDDPSYYFSNYSTREIIEDDTLFSQALVDYKDNSFFSFLSNYENIDLSAKEIGGGLDCWFEGENKRPLLHGIDDVK